MTRYKRIYRMLITCGYDSETAEGFINDARYGCILALHWIKGVYALSKLKGETGRSG